ncbi:MAG: hypothetical protein NZ772_18635 [Cyanobacteria bacterium]|nr:hypothetical protein [Cyanobacteriota bacterium]
MTNDVPDSEVLTNGLEAMAGDIEPVSADRACDHRHCYDEVVQRVAKLVMPPRQDMLIWQHGNSQAPVIREIKSLLQLQAWTQRVAAKYWLSSPFTSGNHHVLVQNDRWRQSECMSI